MRWGPASEIHINYLHGDSHRKQLGAIHAAFSLVHVFLRGLFIIDGKGILRQITMNDLPVGRSVDETLRLVQAFQYTDKHGEGKKKKRGIMGLTAEMCFCLMQRYIETNGLF